MRQRGQFPALPFTTSDTGSPSPRSPRSPGSVSSYSNGSSPHPVGVPWGDFSATGNFKFPNMPHKYSSNGRVKKKPSASDGIAKSPGSGKFCFISGSCQCRLKTISIIMYSIEISQCVRVGFAKFSIFFISSIKLWVTLEATCSFKTLGGFLGHNNY